MIDAHDEELIRQLERDEGVRLRPYEDSVGKLSIGVGRNLDDVGISDSEARFLLVNDIDKALHAALDFPWYARLNPTRQRVILNMLFNLGLPRFLRFKKMIAALQHNNYEEAAEEMLESKWRRQVGQRAYRLAQAMQTGEVIIP